MHLAFDIFQGIGIAVAVGIRPFLPALAVGALAAAGVQIDFTGTDFSFLESAPFLIGMGIAGIALLLAERAAGVDPAGGRRALRRALILLVACALALGALEFAGSLARGHYATWPGIVGGVICAAVAVAASAPLIARAGARLERQDARLLPLYVEVAAVLTAVLSVVAPPLGLVALGLVAWLLIAGRRREGQKYAGLRILR